MAQLSERLRKFREETGQTNEPLPKEEAGAEEGDFADYVMPFVGIQRRALSRVAEKGAEKLAGKLAAKGAEEVAESAATRVAKESGKEAARLAKEKAAREYLGKIDFENKPMPGETPFKGEVPAPAGQKVGANKPAAKEGPALDYKKINPKLDKNEEVGAPVYTWKGRMSDPEYKPRKR